MISRKGRLGIMVTEREKFPPFADSNYYRLLCLIGIRNGLVVFVFSPKRIDWDNKSVTGYSYNKRAKRWEKQTYPFPDLIYDRCFFRDNKAYLSYRANLRQLKKRESIDFLGHGLKGKWQVQELLSQDEEIAEYLPETERVTNSRTIRRWLEERGELFLKPQGGSQGRGAMHIMAFDDSRIRYIVKGRDSMNRVFRYGFYDEDALLAWLKEIFDRRNYVIQSYLNLSTEEGEPFDVRSFVQKNKKGRWQLIGMALRIGKPGSLTSNLHGGGRAEQVRPFLARHYGESADGLLQNIETLSMKIAQCLESKHGRLLELGIDLGIDRSGQVWVLEVNSKPGRSIFTRTGNLTARKSAVSNPIHYASYLWDRQLGG